MANTQSLLLDSVVVTIHELQKESNLIPSDRKKVLDELVNFVKSRSSVGQPIYLNFICTHNSRRSHLSQIWAQAAAHYYEIEDVHCFSGGTEATAFNPRAVTAMRAAGFSISVKKEGNNPIYEVKFSESAPTITAFSKKYDDPFNHNEDFAAIMTCSHADENCPLILGATRRIALTYDDPKDFDGTDLEAAKYTERVRQIGREILFAFSQVKSNG